mmetsp:Transcript_28560/g.45967  ORF Transcript_28560/g.45967 Transcript_28560/m.45967 type:complete len:196 (+) Transcript_28560:47-634(+)
MSGWGLGRDTVAVNAANNHIWQQRIRKERDARGQHCQAFYKLKAEEMMLPVEKALTKADAARLQFKQLYPSNSTPTLRKSTPSVRRMTGSCGRVPTQVGANAVVNDSTGPAFLETTTSSLRLIDEGRRRSIPPTPSCRSGASRISRGSSLWREVEDAVKQEIGAVLGPLTEELNRETAARKNAEAALLEAGISMP